MVWFTDTDLLDLAGSRSYNRGTGYLTAVRRIRDLPDGVVATVTGTDTPTDLSQRGRGALPLRRCP